MKAELKALKDEIGAPVDKAEKAKAADPKFLKDLRVVLGANKPYWNNRLVEDTFQGGEYLKKNPRWTALFRRFACDKKTDVSRTPSDTTDGGGGAAGNGNPSDSAGLTLAMSQTHKTPICGLA